MKKYFLYILFTICSVCSIHAEFNLVHKTGAYSELQDNGMQKVHTDYQIMYARPGETVYLYRPEKCTFVGYVRWYCYDTDRTIPDWYSASDSPTGAAIPRIQSTWKADTVPSTRKFKLKNEYGWFGYDLMAVSKTGKATNTSSNYVELKYTMHNGDSVYRIACDQGIWRDYSISVFNDSTTMVEPTLSKRIIFEIRPAKWIADSLENHFKVTPEADNNDYLEEHELIAPTGRQLYIGPKYMYRGSGKKIELKQYHYYSRSNYHYYNSQRNITIPTNDANWKWYVNGVEDPSITLQDNSAQFVPVSSSTPGTVIYTLKYNSSPGYYFNIARFKVTYMDVNEVGPSVNVSQPSKKMNLIYEQTFNYNKPGTTNFAFWNGYIDVDESTYGYYTTNLSSSSRQTEQEKITWSEYAITNRKQVWVSGGTAPQVYQHVDGTNNIADNARKGYMLYVDGSQQPGLVFNLKVHTDLCPGSIMYFYAWVCDASSTGDKNSAPNMDFEVTGIDTDGNEHALTTFTTGEFGINAVAEVGKSAKMERAKWYQIMFPVQFTIETTYPTYRLRITNKSTSSDGNDFAIDDIRIYVQKPPVNPIQASTYDCPTGTIDSITTYLRVDYQAIDKQSDKFYYQWRDFNNNTLKLQYFNNSSDSLYGYVYIPQTEEAIIESGDTCLSLLSFDEQYFNTTVPVVKYIKENIDISTERYVMYIAQPMVVRTNYNYTGHVAVRPQDLGSETKCGTKANLLIAGGTRILINGEALGDSVVGVCGNRSYTLDIVLTYITQNTITDELEEHTTPCRADWLIGDSTYVNNNINIYKYTFDQIEAAVNDYRTTNPAQISKTIVQYLLKQNLLVLDSKTTIIEPTRSLSYTAFPVPGSAINHMSVCLTPRFLYLSSNEPIINMMKVGNKDLDNDLPSIVLDRPRIVRISNQQKNIGSFDLPLYLAGDEGEKYVIDSVYIISTTSPVFHNIKLNANKDTINLVDTVTLSSSNLISLDAGYDYTFHMAFIGESAEDKCNRGYTYFTLRIIPDVVTWYGNNWNDDANWDTYIPMRETSVLLKDIDYIVSFSDTSLAQYDINYTKNQCYHMHFPDGASMYGQELININGIAFIDVKEYAWKWTLTAIPIQGVVTGDIFISASESDDPFVVAPINQTVGTYAEDRVKWQVYHKEFDANAERWKTATNVTTRPFVAGDANMIGINCETNDIDPIIRLPKQDNMYRYYNWDTSKDESKDESKIVWMNDHEYIERDEHYGKPAWNGDSLFILKEIYTNTYLFGNPTFGYINISKLIDNNKDLFTGDYYLEAYGATSIPKKNEMVTFNHNIDNDEFDLLLPPYRGILLKGKSSSDRLIINVSKAYINPLGSNAPIRKKPSANNDITTNIQNNTYIQNIIAYDVLGRSFMVDNLNQLPSGIYIVNVKNKIYKIFVTK